MAKNMRPGFLLLSYVLLSCLISAAHGWSDAAVSLLQRINVRLNECGQPMYTDIQTNEEDTQDPINGAFELRLLNITYFVIMVRSPRSGLWEVMGDVIPDPCGIDRLAISAYDVIQINDGNLGWTASINDALLGKTVSDFGFQPNPPPPPNDNPLQPQRRDGDFLVLPEAYDARDLYPNEYQCKAFIPRSQGSCGSCSHFASSSVFAARLCLQNGRSAESNVIISPQQLVSCLDGCNGGYSENNFNWYVANSGKIKEEWCKPYGSNTDCATTCDDTSGARSFYASNSKTVFGEHAMMMELILNGPGAISINFYNDLFGYSSGVYSRSPNANYVGGHAMMLVGWGVTDNATPYWIIQNSHYGTSTGENGFIRFRRGTDECSIESRGMDVITPKLPVSQACQNVCGNGSTTLANCRCRCDKPFMTGENCDQMILVCQNGGILNLQQDACICPRGFIGTECRNGVKISRYAAEFGDIPYIQLTYVNALVPDDHYLYAFFYDDSQMGFSFFVSRVTISCLTTSPCPVNGTVSTRMSRPTNPGRYRLEIVIVTAQKYIVKPLIAAYFTVLPSYASRLELDAAIATNSPSNIIDIQNSANIFTSAQMGARLDLAVPFRKLAMAQNDDIPQIKVGMLSKPGDVFWLQAPPTPVCYTLPSSLNVKSKKLQFYSTLGRNVWYTVTNSLLPEARKACVNISLPSIPSLPSIVTLNLVDADTGNVLVTTNPTFFVSNMLLIFSTPSSDTSSVTMNVISYLVRAVGVVRTTDTISLFDKNSIFAGTCPCYPNGVLPTPISNTIKCKFKLPKKAAGSPTRAPFKIMYYGNDNNLIPVSATYTQTTAQAAAVAKLGI
jgi:hypothetical protein